MLFIDMILAVAVAISFVPILTGYCAYTNGRSFWLWFALGWLLPLASFFLLVALIAKDEQALVVINADEKVGHGQVVSVMDRVRQIPGVKMGIATTKK